MTQPYEPSLINADATLNDLRKRLGNDATQRQIAERMRYEKRIGARQNELQQLQQQHGQLTEQLNQARTGYETTNRAKADATVAKVEAALRRTGRLAEGQSVWDSPYKSKVQIHHDKVDRGLADLVAQQRKQLGIDALEQQQTTLGERVGKLQGNLNKVNKVNQTDINAQVEQQIQRGAKRYGSYHGGVIGLQLEYMAQQDPNLAAALAKAGPRGVHGLSPEQQMSLLKQYTKTEAGRNLAKEFSTRWAGPTSQYSSLGNALIAPKKTLDWATKGLGGIAGKSKNIGLAALATFAPSAGMYGLGRYMENSAARGAQQTFANTLAEAMTKAKAKAPPMELPQMPTAPMAQQMTQQMARQGPQLQLPRMPQQPQMGSAREVTKNNILSSAKNAVGGWWQRMMDRYGGGA